MFMFVSIPWKDGTTRDEGIVGSVGVNNTVSPVGFKRVGRQGQWYGRSRGMRRGRGRWRSRYVQRGWRNERGRRRWRRCIWRECRRRNRWVR